MVFLQPKFKQQWDWNLRMSDFFQGTISVQRQKIQSVPCYPVLEPNRTWRTNVFLSRMVCSILWSIIWGWAVSFRDFLSLYYIQWIYTCIYCIYIPYYFWRVSKDCLFSHFNSILFAEEYTFENFLEYTHFRKMQPTVCWSPILVVEVLSYTRKYTFTIKHKSHQCAPCPILFLSVVFVSGRKTPTTTSVLTNCSCSWCFFPQRTQGAATRQFWLGALERGTFENLTWTSHIKVKMCMFVGKSLLKWAASWTICHSS